MSLAMGNQVIHYAVSLGDHRSLVCWMDTDDLMSSSYRLSGKQLQAYRDFAGDGVYRVLVGLEDPEDLCENLAQVLG